MNKFFQITLYLLSIVFSQIALSETIENRTHTLTLAEHLMKEAILQIASDGTIVVDNTHDCDNIMVVFYQGKLKIYYAYPPVEELQRIQEIFQSIYEDDSLLLSHSNDPIFHTPVVNLDEVYYSNPEHCFINAEKSINIREGLIESPRIVLKAKEMEMESFLIGVKTVELQSNNTLSLLSSIKFTLKDNTEFQPIITGDVDFDYNFVAIICSAVSKVELRCLPESFYLKDNAVCFN